MAPHLSLPVRVASGVSFVVAALCWGLVHEPACGGEPDSIAWQGDYAKALEDARAANRLLWVQFTGPWCPNCIRMERDSFPHPMIAEHAQRSFVPLKLRSDVNEGLTAAFNLTAIPATIVIAPNRDIVGFHQGYLDAHELDGLLRDCLAKNPLKPAGVEGDGSSEAQPARPGTTHEKPRAETILGLSGYCPVSLITERKLVKGQSEYSIEYEGRTYRLASRAMSEQFRNEPARHVPGYGGSCPVTRVEQGLVKLGEPRWGVLYAGRLFLCASEQNRRRFLENPARYAPLDLADFRSSSALESRERRVLSR